MTPGATLNRSGRALAVSGVDVGCPSWGEDTPALVRLFDRGRYFKLSL